MPQLLWRQKKVWPHAQLRRMRTAIIGAAAAWPAMEIQEGPAGQAGPAPGAPRFGEAGFPWALLGSLGPPWGPLGLFEAILGQFGTILESKPIRTWWGDHMEMLQAFRRIHCNPAGQTGVCFPGGARGAQGPEAFFAFFLIIFYRFTWWEAFQRVPRGRGYVLKKDQLHQMYLALIHARFHDFAPSTYVTTMFLCERDTRLYVNPTQSVPVQQR